MRLLYPRILSPEFNWNTLVADHPPQALATGHENLGDDSDEMSEGLEPVSRASEQRRESYWQQEDEKPRREPSPMPVVSDIVANKIRTVADDAVPNRVSLPAPAPSLSATENPSEKRGKKRGRPYLKSFEDVCMRTFKGELPRIRNLADLEFLSLYAATFKKKKRQKEGYMLRLLCTTACKGSSLGLP